MDDICRLCGANGTELVPIFSFIDGRLISDLITVLIPIKITIGETLPMNICENCLEVIRTVHNLRTRSIINDSNFRTVDFQQRMCRESEKGLNQEQLEIFNECLSTSSIKQEDSNNFESAIKDSEQVDSWKMSETIKQTTEEKEFFCDKCSAKFRYKKVLHRHMIFFHNADNPENLMLNQNSGTRPVSCCICGLFIPQATNLKRHIYAYHDQALPIKCSLCTYRFSSMGVLKKHGLKFHNLIDVPAGVADEFPAFPIYECDICGCTSQDRNQLAFHMSFRHLKPVNKKTKRQASFLCEYCPRQFANINSMFRHCAHFHASELPFHCDMCQEGFRNDKMYQKHMKNEHYVDDKDLVASKKKMNFRSVASDYICEHCSLNCGTSRSFFEKHMTTSHAEMLQEIYPCPSCDRKYIFNESFYQHQQWHERKELQKTYEYTCSKCKRSFPTEERLKHHSHESLERTPVVCHICGKSMKSKGALVFHIKRHSDKREFQCPQCPQSFVFLRELELHKSSHLNERKFSCPYEGCQKRFNNVLLLNVHNKRHFGWEKRFQCDYCDKRFLSKFVLKRHILIHTKQKPHACRYCNVAFTQKNELVKHLRIHVGDNIYMCEFEGCTAGFRLKIELKQHYAVHYVNNTGNTNETKTEQMKFI